MSPRRTDRSGGDRRRRGRGRAWQRQSTGDGQAGQGQRTRLSHWRADGAAKTRFSSEADANRFALQVRLEHGHDPAVYRCEFCGGWHLGGGGE